MLHLILSICMMSVPCSPTRLAQNIFSTSLSVAPSLRGTCPLGRSHLQFCSPKPGMCLLVPPLPWGEGQRGYRAGFCKGQSWAELLAANFPAGFSWASNLGRGDTTDEHQLRAQVSLFTLTSQMVNVALPTETCSDH